jgi:hypothetical protein
MSSIRVLCARSAFCLLLLIASMARADSPADDARYQAFDLAMARDYLLPRYQSLLLATDKQEQSWAASASHGRWLGIRRPSGRDDA